LLILSLPFILVTMGLFIFVINAFLLLLVSSIIPGFIVAGFWDAFFASIVISLVSYLLSCFFRSSDGKIRNITYHGREARKMKQADARVVDE
jgi:putative membrane protein